MLAFTQVFLHETRRVRMIPFSSYHSLEESFTLQLDEERERGKKNNNSYLPPPWMCGGEFSNPLSWLSTKEKILSSSVRGVAREPPRQHTNKDLTHPSLCFFFIPLVNTFHHSLQSRFLIT